MLSTVLSSATRYFYLPIDEDADDEPPPAAPAPVRRISWTPACADAAPGARRQADAHRAVIREVLAHNDLYKILGVPRTAKLDTLALRRAYLSRSKSCHPDKFSDSPDATRAFQKVSVAYEVLSTPAARRVYDARPPGAASEYDLFAARPRAHAEQTFRAVVLGVFNDFLEGDLEMVKTLLRAVNDLNPSVKLGEDSIDSVLVTLHSIRKRALTCRTCILALHAELARALEIQHACRELPYIALRRRSRYTLQLARLALSLPLVVEHAIAQQALRQAGGGERGDTMGGGMGADADADADGNADGDGEGEGEDGTAATIVPRRVAQVIRVVVVVLERMEKVLS